MGKCEIVLCAVQDSLTAVHRFVAYNAGWLQQALGIKVLVKSSGQPEKRHWHSQKALIAYWRTGHKHS